MVYCKHYILVNVNVFFSFIYIDKNTGVMSAENPIWYTVLYI